MKRYPAWLGALAGTCISLLAAGMSLAQDAESPEPPATATPDPTPTPEPTATATVAPTATPTPEPTATATVAPTATTTPEPTATATVVPTATPTPEPTATAPESTATATPTVAVPVTPLTAPLANATPPAVQTPAAESAPAEPAAAVVASASPTDPRAPAASESFITSLRNDIIKLTQSPHRLSGSPECLAAGRYVEERLRQMGYGDVYTPEWLVPTLTQLRCDVTINGRKVDLFGMRPNIHVPPSTGPDGITAPWVYVGTGTLAEYGSRNVNGAIVAVEYAGTDAWQYAAMMGARAIVFLGKPGDVPPDPKFAPLPANMVRLFAPPEAQQAFDFRQDYQAATLVSHITYRTAVARSVIAVAKGTDVTLSGGGPPQAIVIGAALDSFGQVPHLSPGARGAANIAAVLQLAERLKAKPPKRDVVLAFLDNQANSSGGTRQLYTDLMITDDLAATLASEREQEAVFLADTLNFLRTTNGLGGLPGDLVRVVADEATYIREDVNQEIVRIRLTTRRLENELDRAEDAGNEADVARVRDELARLETRRGELDAVVASWDDVRSQISEGNFQAISADKLAVLKPRLIGQLDARVAELAVLRRGDQARQALRQRLGGNDRVLFHLTFNLSDLGPTFGVVAGDARSTIFPLVNANADIPGYYDRLLSGMRQALSSGAPPTFAIRTLLDSAEAERYVPGMFISDGAPAGVFGIYNVQFMTGYDARARDGHPSDTLAMLDLAHFARQAEQAVGLVGLWADAPSVAVTRKFGNLSLVSPSRWSPSRKRNSGNFAGMNISGNMREDRAALNAVIAAWPGDAATYTVAYSAPTNELRLLGQHTFILIPVDANGGFGLVGVRDDMFTNAVALGAIYGPTGEVALITNQQTLKANFTATVRSELFPARGFLTRYPLTADNRMTPFLLLQGGSDSSFQPNRSLFGQSKLFGFGYIDERSPSLESKVFCETGPVYMDASLDQPQGDGLPLPALAQGVRSTAQSADDLWYLNEGRLSTLRTRGVTSADLEQLQARAADARSPERVTGNIEQQLASLGQSLHYSRRIYTPLRTTMNDLVYAIVALLLLAVPFAFSLERLLIGASTIYGRIAGFAGIYLATFVLLYLMHPGFAIATTPIVIFLAFAIILLSSLVISIVVRKFQTELKALQGRGSKLHAVNMSPMGTMLAAVNMGMSTMRRRPLRTALTAVTVVMLTFTILCFASFGSRLAVRSIYEGPAVEDATADALAHKLDFSQLPADILPLLAPFDEGEGLVASQWWVTRTATTPPISIANPTTGQSALVDSVMGLTPDELVRWPKLAATLGEVNGPAAQKAEALSADGVYLPTIVIDQLGLTVGDPVLLAGYQTTFAGPIDASALQRLRHVDGKSVLPVNFTDPALLAMQAQQTNASGPAVQQDDTVQRDFTRLNPDQVVITSAALSKRLGGNLSVITVYSAPQRDAVRDAYAMATLLPLPVWLRAEAGVERLVFTSQADVSGASSLLVPVLLGGLIIFGTMLGSIADREKEIYTFSALGLAPAHVGFLFLAEASVYAVVGGMGGQLLAQVVALAASAVTSWLELPPPNINFSSTNALAAIAIVMATVLISAIYPAIRASKSANPGVQRLWAMPKPDGDTFRMTFPFTVSSYDITGVISFLAEHFRQHDDAGLGSFAAREVTISRSEDLDQLMLRAELALAPFDLGVTQRFTLTAKPSEIPGVDEVAVEAIRLSGATGDWQRGNRVFLADLRRQFLLWRTLTADVIESYRQQTLETLGRQLAEREAQAAAAASDERQPSPNESTSMQEVRA